LRFDWRAHIAAADDKIKIKIKKMKMKMTGNVQRLVVSLLLDVAVAAHGRVA
jgi:hypothetical protein